MTQGPKHRITRNVPITSILSEYDDPSTLESAEAGLSHTSLSETSRVPKSSSKKTRKIRKGSEISFLLFAPLTRTQLRRLIVSGKRNPKLACIVAAVMALTSLFVAIWIATILQFVGVQPLSRSDTKMKTYTKSADFSRLKAHATNYALANDAKDGHGWSLQIRTAKQITIASIQPAPTRFGFPSHLEWSADDSPDYADLDIAFFVEDGARRNIAKSSEGFFLPEFRDPNAPADDDMDAYYFDDDLVRGQENAYDSLGNHDENKRCRKISEYELNRPSCNTFHEIDRLDPTTNLRYLNAGAYRQVFSLVLDVTGQSDLVAIKDISFNHDFQYDDYEYVRMDALVAERLSSSPRVYNIFGYCGLGIISEYFYHGDIEGDVGGGDDGFIKKGELHDEVELKPQNNLTGLQKLVLSLEMAEAVADLHGYRGGVIVHDDIQLSQFLLNKNKTRLVLNDFNRAELPMYDEASGQYCRYKNGKGHGNWRGELELSESQLC